MNGKKVNLKKLLFKSTKCTGTFLGHILTLKGRKTYSRKVDAIKQMSALNKNKCLQSFQGMTNY